MVQTDGTPIDERLVLADLSSEFSGDAMSAALHTCKEVFGDDREVVRSLHGRFPCHRVDLKGKAELDRQFVLPCLPHVMNFAALHGGFPRRISVPW